MPRHADTAALVALLRSGVHPLQLYADLLEEQGEVAAAGGGLFVDAPDELEQAQADVGRWEAAGQRIVTVLDPDYPENLLAVHDRPPFLFIAGRLLASDARGVAVIGSRRASDAGLALAGEVAERLVEHGYTVVSGLAAGIDTAAHRSALASGGRTIAVIGTGLAHSYPPENAELQRRIADECAVISQFWPDTPPSRRTFPMRNAVMSGMSLATVIVEASQTSGARTQARLALAHGRPVIVMKHLLGQEWGRALAARPGVHVAATADQVADVVERISSATTPLEP
jgi:DNA processing protein